MTSLIDRLVAVLAEHGIHDLEWYEDEDDIIEAVVDVLTIKDRQGQLIVEQGKLITNQGERLDRLARDRDLLRDRLRGVTT